jgi:menaquinone-specific isochorismate synthase
MLRDACKQAHQHERCFDFAIKNKIMITKDFYLEKSPNLDTAKQVLKNYLLSFKPDLSLSFSITLPIEHVDNDEFYSNTNNILRFFYQSKDLKRQYLGMGISNLIKQDTQEKTLSLLMTSKNNLGQYQIYFGGLRFDENAVISPQWQDFGKAMFVLPLVLLGKVDNNYFLQVNYTPNYFVNFAFWQDMAQTLINLLGKFSLDLENPQIKPLNSPSKIVYEKLMQKALNSFSHTNQKVVLGRRNDFLIAPNLNSLDLTHKLKAFHKNTFIFLLDLGNAQAFLGSSPELLFSKEGANLTTEALAGSKINHHPFSKKDLLEHEFVSKFIKDIFENKFNTSLKSGELEIKNLAHIAHLRQKFFAYMPFITEKEIILNLHPTPAVCGFGVNFAKNFIALNESFDRGYYAGTLGIISRESSEFCVAIRSGLINKNNLYVYAACGIVEGSVIDTEWAELDAKQKKHTRYF